MRPEAHDPTALEPQAASLRVARLADPCPWGMVLWLLSQGLYLAPPFPFLVAYQEQRHFHSCLHVYLCVVCTYVLTFICVWTHIKVDIICLSSLLLLRQGLSLGLDLTDEASLARQRPWGIPSASSVRAGITGGLPSFLGFYVDIQALLLKLS